MAGIELTRRPDFVQHAGKQAQRCVAEQLDHSPMQIGRRACHMAGFPGGGNLVSLRHAHGLSQDRLAELENVPVRSLSGGKTPPSASRPSTTIRCKVAATNSAVIGDRTNSVPGAVIRAMVAADQPA